MSTPVMHNSIRNSRLARNWTQQQLADRAGIARANVSAIEMGRLIPSTAVALALAAAFDCRVESLFQLGHERPVSIEWAWPAPGPRTRYWQAEVFDRHLVYPVEDTCIGTLPHDGLADPELQPRTETQPMTLIIACCDPAIGLLTAELARNSGIRLISFVRSSRAALELLKQKLVHMAGLHLEAADGKGNELAVKTQLGDGYRLARMAHWEEGVATDPSRRFRSLDAVAKAKMTWVGRESGSGARQCLDQLLGSRVRFRRMADSHRGVAEAIRNHWADAGVCLRLTGEEKGLRFLPIRQEAYDLCYPESLANDPRLTALFQTIRSVRYRQLVNDLPGYSSHQTGEIHDIN